MSHSAKLYLYKVLANRYRVDRLVGEGSFAWVYHATSSSPAREVAIKVLHSTESTAAMRFAREIEVLKKLPANENVVALVDAGQTPDGRPIQVLEYIDGITLKDGMRLCKAPIPKQAVAFMIDLCRAFVGLHQLGVAHRDVKPENILLSRKGGIKLIDFGLIRDAQGILQLLEQEDPVDQRRLFSQELDRWTVAGTPEYMAPEQFSDAKIEDLALARTDTWSDVFSLGVIFYQLLSGKKPFPMRPITKGEYHREILRYMRMRMELTDENYPECPGIDDALDSILRKALRQDPRKRQPDARALMDDLVRYQKTGLGVFDDDEELTQALDTSRSRLHVLAPGRTVDITRPIASSEGATAPPAVETPSTTPPPRAAGGTVTDSKDVTGTYYPVVDFEDDEDETHLEPNPEVLAIVEDVRSERGTTNMFFDHPVAGGPSPTTNENASDSSSDSSQAFARSPRDASASQAFAQSPRDASTSQAFAQSPRDASTSQAFTQSPHEASSSQALAQSPHEASSSQELVQSPHEASYSRELVQSPHEASSSREFVQRALDASTSQALAQGTRDASSSQAFAQGPRDASSSRVFAPQALDASPSQAVAQGVPGERSVEQRGSSYDEQARQDAATGSADERADAFEISIDASDSVIITEEPREGAGPDTGVEPSASPPDATGFAPSDETAHAQAGKPNPWLPPWTDVPDWDEHAPTNVQSPPEVDELIWEIRKKK